MIKFLIKVAAVLIIAAITYATGVATTLEVDVREWPNWLRFISVILFTLYGVGYASDLTSIKK